MFTENVTLGSSLSIGTSKRGNRNIIPITGGSVSGRVTGPVLYGGGDYQLVGGTTKLDARYVISSSGDLRHREELRAARRAGAAVRNARRRTVRISQLQHVRQLRPGLGGGGVSITFYQRQ